MTDAAAPAVFFDRDGVLNLAVVRDGKPNPPADASEFAVEDGAALAVRKLAARLPLMFVFSNQPDVARGTRRISDVLTINRLVARNFPITEFFICFHDDGDKCTCRKPLPGMLLSAAESYSLDLSRSYVIGDTWRDVAAGNAAGCTTILIDRRYPDPGPIPRPSATVSTLVDAVEHIISETNSYIARRKHA